MRLLYIAEIVGKAGIDSLKKGLKELKADYQADFVFAGADSVTNGNGLGRMHAGYVRKLGVDVLCLGDSAFLRKDLVENLERLNYILRPANITTLAPGRGYRTFWLEEKKIAIISLLGQASFSRLQGDSPGEIALSLVERLRKETPIVLVDFHAQATAEKYSLFRLLDGRCTAIIGSHTLVQTADAQISAQGTAFICDAGRTGSQDSVGGNSAQSRIHEYISGIPDWTREAWERQELQGVFLEVDDTGKALQIEPFRRSLN